MQNSIRIVNWPPEILVAELSPVTLVNVAPDYSICFRRRRSARAL
jgi:hypothetical protein